MEYKDYFKTLGVERNAKKEEIKRAYRKLALQYHPDRNPGDKKAEDKFKEINEAYQVLSDPEKRRRYEQLGESYARYTQRGGAPGSFNWDDWFTQSPVGGSRRGNVRVEAGGFEDIFGGGFSEFFTRIFGGRPDVGTTSWGQAPSQSRSELPVYQQEVEITLLEAYQGTTRRLEMEGRRLDIKIPAGARTGTKVRVADAVSAGAQGQKADLYLVIRVLDDPRFERKGDDLYTDVTVDIYNAVLGGEVTILTLSGNVVLKIPEGTQPGQTFRLAGRGMPHIKRPDVHGDLLARTKVKIPRNLTPQQRELFQQLAEMA